MFRMDNASWTAFLSHNVSTARTTTMTTTTRGRNTTRQEKTQRKHNLSQTHEQQKQQEREKQPSAVPSPIHAKAKLRVKIWDMLRTKLSRHQSKTDGSLNLNRFGLRRMGRKRNADLGGEQDRLRIRGGDDVELGHSKPEAYNTEIRSRCVVHIPLKRCGAIRGRKAQVIKTTLKRSGAIRGRKPRAIKTSLKRSGAIRGRKPRDILHCIFTTTRIATPTITSTTQEESIAMSADVSSEDILTTCDNTDAVRLEEIEAAVLLPAHDACTDGAQRGPLSAQHDNRNHHHRKDDVSGLKPSAWMHRARPGLERTTEPSQIRLLSTLARDKTIRD